MTRRTDKINSTLMRAIQERLARGLADPRIRGLITVTAVECTPAFPASWAWARFWSRRVIALKRSGGTSGAEWRAMRQFVLQGLPTTATLQPSAATASIASP